MRLSMGKGRASSLVQSLIWFAFLVEPLLPAFKEQEPVRVEELARIGQELQPLVLDTAIDRPERRKQPDPRIMPPFQDLLAILVGGFLKSCHDCRDGVVGQIDRVVLAGD